MSQPEERALDLARNRYGRALEGHARPRRELQRRAFAARRGWGSPKTPL